LHKSGISKPQPLRITKRSQTITCSSAPREIIGGGRGWSCGSDQSRGSPPLGPDRPLTVYKVRKGRGSILNGDLEEGLFEIQPASEISDLIQRHSGKVFEKE